MCEQKNSHFVQCMCTLYVQNFGVNKSNLKVAVHYAQVSSCSLLDTASLFISCSAASSLSCPCLTQDSAIASWTSVGMRFALL